MLKTIRDYDGKKYRQKISKLLYLSSSPRETVSFKKKVTKYKKERKTNLTK